MAYLHNDREQFKDTIPNSFAPGIQLYRRDDGESS